MLYRDIILNFSYIYIFVLFVYNLKNLIPISSISLEAEEGSLIAVVGVVGAGKSSLLAAILGEMDKTSGSVAVRVSVFVKC